MALINDRASPRAARPRDSPTFLFLGCVFFFFSWPSSIPSFLLAVELSGFRLFFVSVSARLKQ